MGGGKGRGGGFCFLAIGGGGGRGIGVKAGGDRRRADQTVLDLNFVREKIHSVFWTLFPCCFSQERRVSRNFKFFPGKAVLSFHKTWVHGVVEIPPLVHPDLGHARRVLVDDLGHAAGEGVRRLVAEDVAHVRARDNLQDAAALPNLHNASFLKIII